MGAITNLVMSRCSHTHACKRLLGKSPDQDRTVLSCTSMSKQLWGNAMEKMRRGARK
jgi:hypothetical protein